jgi:LysM repeat protein
VPWIAAIAIVLGIAVTAGFVAAYIVASGRAVDAPSAGSATPTPTRTAIVTQAPQTGGAPTGEPSEQPRRTPTLAPVITPTPEPIEHTISRGESLSYIAGLYCTTVDAIQELNDIANPNRIQVGQVIQIPGGGCESAPPD